MLKSLSVGSWISIALLALLLLDVELMRRGCSGSCSQQQEPASAVQNGLQGHRLHGMQQEGAWGGDAPAIQHEHHHHHHHYSNGAGGRGGDDAIGRRGGSGSHQHGIAGQGSAGALQQQQQGGAPASPAFQQLPNTTQDPELQVQGIFHKALKSNARQPLILDIGMNAARFTLLAASHGARVIAVDPQFPCVRRIESHLASAPPHLSTLITVLHAAVGQPGGALQMSRNGPDVCDPAFGVGGTERQGGAEVKEAVPIIGVQSFLREKQHVRLVKVDTEGAEVQILEQLLPFVRMGQVDEIMVEVMPGNWKHRGADTARGTAVLSELQRLSNATLLLYDPAPFGMSGMRQVPPSELGPGGSEVPGPLYSGFKAADLVQDRMGHDATPGFQGIPHGCNIWFVVNGRPLKQRGVVLLS